MHLLDSFGLYDLFGSQFILNTIINYLNHFNLLYKLQIWSTKQLDLEAGAILSQKKKKRSWSYTKWTLVELCQIARSRSCSYTNTKWILVVVDTTLTIVFFIPKKLMFSSPWSRTFEWALVGPLGSVSLWQKLRCPRFPGYLVFYFFPISAVSSHHSFRVPSVFFYRTSKKRKGTAWYYFRESGTGFMGLTAARHISAH